MGFHFQNMLDILTESGFGFVFAFGLDFGGGYVWVSAACSMMYKRPEIFMCNDVKTFSRVRLYIKKKWMGQDWRF